MIKFEKKSKLKVDKSVEFVHFFNDLQIQHSLNDPPYKKAVYLEANKKHQETLIEDVFEADRAQRTHYAEVGRSPMQDI